MGCTQSKEEEIPKGSPLDLVLRHWTRLTGPGTHLRREELCRLCIHMWPLHELLGEDAWPKFGSLEKDAVLHLMSVLEEGQRWNELVYAELFLAFLTRPEFMAKYKKDKTSEETENSVMALERKKKKSCGKQDQDQCDQISQVHITRPGEDEPDLLTAPDLREGTAPLAAAVPPLAAAVPPLAAAVPPLAAAVPPAGAAAAPAAAAAMGAPPAQAAGAAGAAPAPAPAPFPAPAPPAVPASVPPAPLPVSPSAPAPVPVSVPAPVPTAPPAPVPGPYATVGPVPTAVPDPAPFPAPAGTKASGSAIMTGDTAPSAAPAMATDLGVSCNQQPAPPVLEGEADENSIDLPFPPRTFAMKALSWFSSTIPAYHPEDLGSNSNHETITSSVCFPFSNLTEWFRSGPGSPSAKPLTGNLQTNVTLSQSSEYQPRPPPWPPPAENRLSPEREKGGSAKQFHHLVTRATCHLTACRNYKGLRGRCEKFHASIIVF